MNNKTWEKMGIAYCNVVEKDRKKTLIVRAATTLGNIWINTLINNHFKAFTMAEKKLKVCQLDNIVLEYLASFYCFKIRFPTTVKTKVKEGGDEVEKESIKIQQYLLTVGSPDECKKLGEYLESHDIQNK